VAALLSEMIQQRMNKGAVFWNEFSV